ncbi:Purine-cytosine permease [Phaffia rhodozyma]|uniref:Purine-cytosine permease n=1 Tax=Phaffia rhodozyma TaxID=264483 RepID=A0A0F7SRS5_PHARH|nr:Purine-cytosine permease [Phaffia rhodozyma]
MYSPEITPSPLPTSTVPLGKPIDTAVEAEPPSYSPSVNTAARMDDIEKGVYSDSKPNSIDHPVRVAEHEESNSFLRFLDRMNVASTKLESKLGMEVRGIERVQEDQRTDNDISGSATIWLAANCVLSTFGIGILGPAIFGLGLGDSLLCIFFTNAATAIVPAYAATFGPKLGLRQMTSARYAWGWHGAKIVALLNCIACVGWSAINTIAGAQALRVVADDKISHAAGIIIIAFITLVVGLLGYKWVHRYERYSWIPTAITFIVLLGCGAKGLSNVPMATGEAAIGGCLSFIGTIFGFAMGWVSLASDYNVYQSAETSSLRVFSWTYGGLIFPLVLVEWLGAAIMCGALANQEGTWYTEYLSNELGGLVGAVFRDHLGQGGTGFFLFLLVLSVVSNNIINVYSLGLSISVVHRYIARVPRIVWPVVITGIYIGIAIAGADSFASALENFMNVLGYWLSIFAMVVFEEHFIFRKGSFANYNAAESWNCPALLPVGYAALAAFCAGAAGAALGMSQVWFVGPIGGLIGEPGYGADIGFELSGGFAGVVYPVARYLELKYVGR